MVQGKSTKNLLSIFLGYTLFQTRRTLGTGVQCILRKHEMISLILNKHKKKKNKHIPVLTQKSFCFGILLIKIFTNFKQHRKNKQTNKYRRANSRSLTVFKFCFYDYLSAFGHVRLTSVSSVVSISLMSNQIQTVARQSCSKNVHFTYTNKIQTG